MRMRTRILFRVLLMILILLYPSWGNAERILGKGSGVQISDQDVELFQKYLIPKNVEPTDRALFEAILKTKLFYKAALDSGMDKKKDVRIMLELEKQKNLAQVYALDYLEKNLKIDEAVIKSYYLSHIEEFTMPARLKLYRIVVMSPEHAQKVFAEAKIKPEDFPKIVEKYSIDPSTKWKKGEMGWISFEKLRPEIKKALGEPKVNALTKPIEIHGFYYIFWVKELQPKRVIPLNKLTMELKEKIAQQKRQQILQEHLQELKKKYGFQWDPSVQSVMNQRQHLGIK